MGSYSNSKKANIKTKIYEGTYSFPTENVIPGTKAIDSLNDVIYYWNGVGWFRLDTEEAAVRTFNLISNKLSITEGSDVDITLETTNVTDGTLVGYTWYIRTASGSGTTNTGNFTINDTGGRLIVLNIPEDIGTNPELVIELENNKSSLIIPIVPLTINIDYWRRGGIFLEDGETLTWTVPDGVTSISVAAVAAGNSALQELGEDVAGGGGALAYSNNISVLPGEIYELRGAQARYGQSSYIREQGSLDFVVFAEGGFNSRTWEAAGVPKASGGRASASIGNVKYSGLAGGFGTLNGVAGGSAADWDGSSIAQNADWGTGRGGYGTNPNGQGQNARSKINNSNEGASYGGGGGARNPNANQGDPTAGWGRGAPGFLKILYPGDTRAFPSTDASITTEEIYKITTPKTITSLVNFEVAVELNRVPANLNLEVNVTGLPGGTQTKSHVQPSFSINESTTYSFSFTVPEILSSTPVVIDVVQNGTEIISRSVTATIGSTRVIDFADTTASGIVAVNTFFDSLGYTGSGTTSGTWSIENGSLNTTGTGVSAYYIGGDTVIANDIFEFSFWLRWDGTRTNGSGGIISTIPTPLGSRWGLTIDSDYQWIGDNSFTAAPVVNQFLLGDNRWHRYSILRNRDYDVILSRDGNQLASISDTRGNQVSLLPLEIGERYVNYNVFSFKRFSNYSIANIRFNSEGFLSEYGTAPVIPADYTVSVTNSGNAYIFSGTVGSTNYNNSNQPTITVNEGDIIQFNINSSTSSGHPFYIKTQQSTGTGNQAPGVTGNGTTTVRFDTAIAGPGTYGYQCSIHFGMWNTITVV